MDWKRRNCKKDAKQWDGGYWDLPHQTEANAIEQSAQLGDKFRRCFQSQLRQMRDWRRYGSPVIINNPEQVNIAGEGGQQVNVANAKDS